MAATNTPVPNTQTGALPVARSRVLPVPERLSRYVAALWVAEHASGEALHVLPDGTIDVVLATGPAFQGVFVSGPLRRFARYESSAALQLVGASLQPGAAALLGISAHELRTHWQALSLLALPEARQLEPGASLNERVRALCAFLEARTLHGAGDVRVERAVHALHAAGGALHVASLARALRVSERTLLRLFERHVGLAPKNLARIVRFQRVLVSCRAQRAPNLAALAQEHGYADQAHLTRDLRELAGLTPAALLRRFEAAH